MSPAISVIMLTYNREDMVSRMIECILAQTFRNFEFIIVDNGSSDRSGAIADEYAAKDERIRVIHRERGNIGAGRNTGLDAAKGEYIAFVDDDDWCEPDYLEFLYNLAEENGADVSICGVVKRNKTVCAEKKILNAEELLVLLLWRGWKNFGVGFPAKLVRKELFNGFRFSYSVKFEDVELMPRLFSGAKQAVFYGVPKYTARSHEGNTSAWMGNHALLQGAELTEFLQVFKARREFLCEKFPEKANAWRCFEWSFQLSMLRSITEFSLSECADIGDELRQELMKVRAQFAESEYILDNEREWLGRYVPAS